MRIPLNPLRIFLAYFQKYIDSLEKSQKFGNYKRVKTVYNKLCDFLEGKDSGIDSSIIEDVYERLATQIPEVFKIIDRLLIDLVDNVKAFRDNKDLWVSVSIT